MKAVCFLLQILVLGLFSSFSISGQTTPTTPDPKATIVTPQSDNEDERYRIGFQDTVEVSVYGPLNDKLSRKYSINSDGTIDLVRGKPIKAVCKTERELAREIEAEYLTFLRKPEVNVFVVEKKSQ